jgi:hypothetical protein
MASHVNSQNDTSLDDSQRFMNSGPMAAPVSEDWYHGHKVVAYPGSAFGGKHPDIFDIWFSLL